VKSLGSFSAHVLLQYRVEMPPDERSEWSLRNQFMVVIGLLFAILGGVVAMRSMRLDAIPDLSDVQVIIYTEYPGQAPQVVEDQVTYPVTSKMLSVPFAKVVRGYSFFGFSFVYVIFERHGGSAPRWGGAPARTGRDGCRLGLHVRAQLTAAFPG
jgi:hypothetical protein